MCHFFNNFFLNLLYIFLIELIAFNKPCFISDITNSCKSLIIYIFYKNIYFTLFSTVWYHRIIIIRFVYFGSLKYNNYCIMSLIK